MIDGPSNKDGCTPRRVRRLLSSLMGARDDFSEAVKRNLANRVGSHCSNPGCLALTSGPHEDATKSVNLGVAAHITAAALGGPRYDVSLTQKQRSSADNAIWLCQNCAKLIDSDPVRFPVTLLRDWRTKAEAAARSDLGKTAAPAARNVPVSNAPTLDRVIDGYAPPVGEIQATTNLSDRHPVGVAPNP